MIGVLIDILQTDAIDLVVLNSAPPYGNKSYYSLWIDIKVCE